MIICILFKFLKLTCFSADFGENSHKTSFLILLSLALGEVDRVVGWVAASREVWFYFILNVGVIMNVGIIPKLKPFCQSYQSVYGGVELRIL